MTSQPATPTSTVIASGDYAFYTSLVWAKLNTIRPGPTRPERRADGPCARAPGPGTCAQDGRMGRGTLCYPPACVRHSPGGLPCTGRSFPLLLDSSFPALRHVSGMLPVVLTQGVVLYRSLLPLHLCCPQACVRYAPCGISPGGLPCTGRWADTFSSFHHRSFNTQ